MLKQTVTYNDFNGVEQTENLYFHISMNEAFTLLQLKPRIDNWAAKFQGADPESFVPIADIQELLDVIKELIEISYGERSTDGVRFFKDKDTWRRFRYSAAYDAFLMMLFGNGGKNAIDFLNGVIPKDVTNRLEQMAAEGATGQDATTGGEQKAVEEEVPVWVREGRDPNKQEIMNMTPQQMQQEYLRKMQQNNTATTE